MGLLSKLFKKKKVEVEEVENVELSKFENNIETINATLNEEIKNFFPKTGLWMSYCFQRASDVYRGYLPCHLRDYEWMSKLLHKELKAKNIFISQKAIKEFMDNSKEFEELRHNYELEIIRWQINWIKGGGEGWIMPEGVSELSMIFHPEDDDKIFRNGVLLTLAEIGMNIEVVQEGIEKYSDLWRPTYMRMAFEHQFNPYVLFKGCPPKVDEEHKKNWIKAREYEYYQEYQQYVDRYGTPTENMKMTEDEYIELSKVLTEQNIRRKSQIKEWMENTEEKYPYKNFNYPEA